MKTKLFLLVFILSGLLNLNSYSAADDGTFSTASTIQEAENIIYNAIINRINTFQIRYTGNADNILDDIKFARDAAVVKSPYDEACISLISGFNVSKYADHADISFTGFAYYTTKAQEEYVGEQIQNIASGILDSQMNDLQKVKTIHDYIVRHISYDSTLAGYTAYSALHDGKTVCNGYVQVAYRLFEKAGLQSMIVKGTYSDNAGVKDHTWNLVKVGGYWRHVDCTLDDSLSSGDSFSYKYYGLNDTGISADHTFDHAQYPAANGEPLSAVDPVTPTVTLPVAGTGSAAALSAGAPSQEYQIIDKYASVEQPANKIWKLVFNQTIDLSTVEPGNITVLDSSGQPVRNITVGKEASGRVIVIYPPAEGYRNGGQYTICISKNLKSDIELNLKKAIKIPFIVKGK